MPTQSLDWEYGASSGNTQPKGLLNCPNAQTPGLYGYVGVSSTCYDTCAHVYFETYIYASCLKTITVPDFTYDGRTGTFCDENLVSLRNNLYNCGSQVTQSPEFAGCVRVIGASTGTIYYEAYRFLDYYYTTIIGGTATVDEDGVYLRVYVPNKRSDEVSYIGLGPLPESIEYTVDTSVPASTTSIDTSNTTTVGGTTYYYKSGTSLTVSTLASGGCPKSYTYHNIVTQDGSTIGQSTNSSATFTLSKCTFGHPYTVTGYVSNASGDSAETTYKVLMGGAPESLILNNSVVYLAPGTQTKLILSGKTYANDISVSIGATTSNVVNYSVTRKTVDTNTGSFSVEITLTGVFTNPSTYLNISVTDFYGTTAAPQCYIEGGVESSFTVSPRYPLVSETVVFTNTSITGTGISYTWLINNTDPLTDNDNWTANYSGNNLVATFKKGATYSISLKTQYLTQFEDTFVLDIDVGKTVNASEPSARYKVLIRNKDNYDSVLIGRSVLVPNNGKCVFANLKFAARENESSQASFRLIGANTLIGVSYANLIRQGSKVFIVDDNVVVWSGIITDISETNTKSPYSTDAGFIKYHDIVCMDALYELMYEQYEGDTQTVTDTVRNLLVGTSSYDGILPDNSAGILGYEAQGVEELTQSVSYPFTSTDRYSLLTHLISLVSWNYRTRPNVIEAKTPCTVNGNVVTYSSSNNVQDGDMIYVDVGGYQDGLYHRGTLFGVFTNNIITTNKTFTFNVGSVNNPLGKTNGYVTVVRMQSLYDIAPSFYQNEYVRRYTVDKDINNVSNSASVNDKYGIVSVTTRSLQGTTITSQMKGFMKINPDYSIPSAYVVVKSIDTYVTSYRAFTPLDPDADTEFGVGHLYLKGWSIPTDLATLNIYDPSFVWYPSYSPTTPIYDDFPKVSSAAGGMITAVTRYLGTDNEKYTDLSIQEVYDRRGGVPSDQTTWLSTHDFELGQFIMGKRYTLNTTEGLAAGDHMLLGDEHVVINTISGNDIVVTRYSSDLGGAHGHLVGTLAFKVTSSLSPTERDIEDDSPMDLYGNTIYTMIAANGQTQMEIELIAQNLLRFGSNYMDNGSATIPLIYFGKTDKGMFSPFNVGDHLSIQPAYSDSNARTEFELVGYEIDTQKYVASVTYGMPTKTMADILRGVSTNQMVTISNSDYV